MTAAIWIYLAISVVAMVTGTTTNRRDVEIACQPLGWSFGIALIVFAWGWPIWLPPAVLKGRIK